MMDMKRLVIIGLLLIAILSGCHSSNQIMTAKMLDKYADDANYVTLQGRIVAVNENDLVIECDGLKAYLSYEDKLCDYHVST